MVRMLNGVCQRDQAALFASIQLFSWMDAFYWVGNPAALPVEVPRNKALASSIERSELLTTGYQR